MADGQPGIEVGTDGTFVPPAPASGDAGKNFIDNLMTAPLDAEGAHRVADGGADLKQQALNGGFAINEAGLQAYLKACDKFLDGFEYWKRQLELLGKAAQMGSSNYARQVAQFNVTVHEGDASSLMPNLMLMRDGIENAKAALIIARKNYRETEERHSVNFRKLNQGLHDS
ncbi:hypothetical protein [Amycolatopsis sp. H20-H5]|uniref:hypothetical protein n=1 Tax=Amycolatopsis sp. H20-H5 TaxID=3046309 RepID=UPI002DBE4548|nr:hypothetical protein [Amycolatopsis sp. H20-H5]MEC3975074.1 hypothetical protein [Amycolatopsis sp. H20-H5]